ncbi:MAG: glutaredoxin family protein [Endomicrobiales bacterium]|nr:glutaredoxin family protein [Endomicrobiales bacterium]
MAKEIKVYSTSTCPYCAMLKSFLAEKNVTFTNFDVGKDRNALTEMKNKSGQMGVPVTDIDGRIIVGFNKEEISKALGI